MKTSNLKALTLFSAVLMLLLSTCVFAQHDERKPPPGSEDEHFKAPHMMKHPKHHKGKPPIPDLTDEQKAHVARIVANRVSEFKNILIDVHPRIAEQLLLLEEEVAQVLNEEQKGKWKEHFRKMQRKFERYKPKISRYQNSHLLSEE